MHPLDPLYVNQRRVATLVGAEVLCDALARVGGWDLKQHSYLSSVKSGELLRSWLEATKGQLGPVQESCLKQSLAPGDLFTYEGHLWCRNAHGRNRKQKPLAYVELPQLGPNDNDVKLEFLLHPTHVVVGSPGELLSRKVANLFVLAHTHRVTAERIEAVPIFIGYLRKQGMLEYPLPVKRNEVFVDGIDNFERAATIESPSTNELEFLRDIPEETVKNAFAEIVGEPDIPKDWGGERSDLYTTALRIERQRISAAFLFKGPAGGKRFREMRIADLGKNGDQIERLCTEPADLLVVQHCHKIGSAVRNTIRAFCNQVGNERRYCIVSGFDTLRILKAYRKCGL